MGALHADLLSDYYKTLSCLQEQLIVKAIKVASRIYLKPGEYVGSKKKVRRKFLDESQQLLLLAVSFSPCTWIGFDLKKDFLERSFQLFRSAPTPLTSVEEVNQWVEEATDDHIKNFLSILPPNVVLMLINAVHFKGKS